MKDISAIAYEAGLGTTTVTFGSNGYPSNLRLAITDFEDFDEAMHIAEANDLDIVVLHQRDGWNLWECKGTTDRPLTISAADYGNSYRQYTKGNIDDIVDEAKETILGMDNLDAMEETLSRARDVADEVADLEDDQMLIVNEDNLIVDTIREQMMKWSYDTHHYCIAVMEI